MQLYNVTIGCTCVEHQAQTVRQSIGRMPFILKVSKFDKSIYDKYFFLPEFCHPTLLQQKMPSAIELAAPDRKNGEILVQGNANELLTLVGNSISNFPPDKSYSIAIKEVPVTAERLPNYPKEGDRLQDPGTARANVAPSNESPNGTTEDDWARNHRHQTVSLSCGGPEAINLTLTSVQVVQQHVDYWDRDHDGIIWPQVGSPQNT